MSTLKIQKSIYINAPRETVWLYLTDKDRLGTWFHPAKENLKLGEDYMLMQEVEGGGESPIIWGRVVEMLENEKLVTTFMIKQFGASETTVHWHLESVSCGTRLTLIHDGIEEAAGEAAAGLMLALDAGWDEHFLSLRKLQ